MIIFNYSLLIISSYSTIWDNWGWIYNSDFRFLCTRRLILFAWEHIGLKNSFWTFLAIIGDHSLRIHPIWSFFYSRSGGRLVMNRVTSSNCHIVLVDCWSIIGSIDIVVVSLAISAHLWLIIFVTATCCAALFLFHRLVLIYEGWILSSFIWIYRPALL